MSILQDRIQQSLTKGKVSEYSSFSGFRERMKKMVQEEVEKFKSELVTELRRIMEEKIGEEGITKIKGERGYSPQKGTDYFTHQELQEIADSIRPIKGKDFFDGLAGKDGISPPMPNVRSLILKELGRVKMPNAEMVASKIARDLEKLQGQERLDYN